MKRRRLSINLLALALFAVTLSCGDKGNEAGPKEGKMSLTSFYPTEGGARDKILLDGENFGNDPSTIKVYFNNARATVISSSGNRIYALVPRLPGANPKIAVVVGSDSLVYEQNYIYHT